MQNSFLSLLKNRIIDFAKKNNLFFYLGMHFIRRDYFQKQKLIFGELKRIEKLSEQDKSEIQEEQMFRILTYAHDNCPYYRKLFDDYHINISSIDSLKAIPFLTKEIVSKEGRSMLSETIKKTSLVKRNTGGSTGEPLEFYSDAMAGAIDSAHHRYLYSIMGTKSGDIIARGGGIFVPRHLRNRNIYWIKNSKYNVWGDIGYSSLYLTEETIKFYIWDFLKAKPSILRGYPSFWSKMAEYILANKISLPFSIKGIILTAEICLEEQRKIIEEVFSSQVYFEYGQAELVCFCYTRDKTYTYETSPIYGYLEVIKDNGEEAEEGEEGEVIATSFCNIGMPFIRYKTGDRIRVEKRNRGMVYFRSMHGRSQDYIISNDCHKIPLTALIFGQHFRAFGKIASWQLVQNEIGEVVVKIVKRPGYSCEDEKEIRKKFQDVADFELAFDYVKEIPLTISGKRSFLVQNIREQVGC